MHIVKIPKRNGKFRTIYVPTPNEKNRSLHWIPHLLVEIRKHPHHNLLHGFMPGRSPVTNALAHSGYMFSLSFDMQDWFDSIKREHVLVFSPNGVFTSSCFYEGAPRQGLPSSPYVANLAMLPILDKVMKLQTKGRFVNFVCTVYADDVTFSSNSMDTIRMLQREFPKIVDSFGYKINPSKTHLQCSKAGRRIICGVAIDQKGVHPPRSMRRRLRAAEHQAKNGLRFRGKRRLIGRLLEIKRQGKKASVPMLQRLQLKGLREWCALRLPKGFVAGHASAQAHAALLSVATELRQSASMIRRFS